MGLQGRNGGPRRWALSIVAEGSRCLSLPVGPEGLACRAVPSRAYEHQIRHYGSRNHFIKTFRA
jgi:hypothetical protein